ncbi:MAG: hypothetical protein WAK50_03770, partial [Nitrososphaeraceae archaeon]
LSNVSYRGSLVEFLLLWIYINAELEIGKSSINLGLFFFLNDITVLRVPLWDKGYPTKHGIKRKKII